MDEKSSRKFLAYFAKHASPEAVAILVEQGRASTPELAKAFTQQGSPEVKTQPNMSAPVLWADRKTGREVSPADFIRLHYGAINEDGSWDNQGLTRADLKHIDITLYNAYSQQVRRNPEREISELPTKPKREEGDAQDILDRRRERQRERMAARRANTLTQ